MSSLVHSISHDITDSEICAALPSDSYEINDHGTRLKLFHEDVECVKMVLLKFTDVFNRV